MSKAFTRETDEEDDDDAPDAGAPSIPGYRNYITPAGYARMNAELAHLWDDERPKLVETITWAAGNGDRSENGDYIYGKRRLREIDRRIRFLSRRIDSAVVVPHTGRDAIRVLFGATVEVEDDDGKRQVLHMVGVDELDPARGRVSWISPIARALWNGAVGDVVTLRTPSGTRELEILAIRYEELP